MPRKSYMPTTKKGIAQMLTSFYTNMIANTKAFATKYNVTDDELTRVQQAMIVWSWFMQAVAVAKRWPVSLNNAWGRMEAGTPQAPTAVPGGPILPPNPTFPTDPPTPALLEPLFMAFFMALVARVKNAENYDVPDGVLLGIEGPQILLPVPSATVPDPSVALTTSGQPEITCPKGLFQGFTANLTRPGQARKEIGFSTSRHYLVTEPLPAAGTAEVWVFDVQYRYKNQPFGQISQPVSVTVRG